MSIRDFRLRAREYLENDGRIDIPEGNTLVDIVEQGKSTQTRAALKEELRKFFERNKDAFVPEASSYVGSVLQPPKLIRPSVVSKAVAHACEQMQKAGHSFAIMSEQRFRNGVWTLREINSGSYQVAPTVRPSDAVRDIFQNPKAYAFDCSTGVNVIFTKAVLDLLGDAKFDEKFSGLVLGSKRSGPITGFIGRKPISKPVAGDEIYFTNPDVSPQAAAGGWQGESAIYLGGDKVYAHPFGFSTVEQVVRELNKSRAPNSNLPASLTGLIRRLEVPKE